jgi:hypothetical protein
MVKFFSIHQELYIETDGPYRHFQKNYHPARYIEKTSGNLSEFYVDDFNENKLRPC